MFGMCAYGNVILRCVVMAFVIYLLDCLCSVSTFEFRGVILWRFFTFWNGEVSLHDVFSTCVPAAMCFYGVSWFRCFVFLVFLAVAVFEVSFCMCFWCSVVDKCNFTMYFGGHVHKTSSLCKGDPRRRRARFQAMTGVLFISMLEAHHIGGMFREEWSNFTKEWTIRMAKVPAARDKLAHQGHHAPDKRKK